MFCWQTYANEKVDIADEIPPALIKERGELVSPLYSEFRFGAIEITEKIIKTIPASAKPLNLPRAPSERLELIGNKIKTDIRMTWPRRDKKKSMKGVLGDPITCRSTSGNTSPMITAR